MFDVNSLFVADPIAPPYYKYEKPDNKDVFPKILRDFQKIARDLGFIKLTPYMSSEEIIPFCSPGDRIVFRRFNVYTHWAIVESSSVEDGIEIVWVIHYFADPAAGKPKSVAATKELASTTSIRRNKLVDVANGADCKIDNGLDEYFEPDSPEAIVEYASSKIGQRGYDLLNKNCEHFATECRYGISRSGQSITAKSFVAGSSQAVIGTSIFAITASVYPERLDLAAALALIGISVTFVYIGKRLLKSERRNPRRL